MIFDLMIDLLLRIPQSILAQIPEVSIDSIPVPDEFYHWFNVMFSFSKTFFPMELLAYIVETMAALRVARLEIAGFKFIRSNIPFMSN